MIPLRGVSALDKEGQKFHDAAADAALFAAIRTNVGANVQVVELDMHINDPEFADAIANQLITSLQGKVDAIHHA
jgi:uncharacterized protein (UPF0261 family)